MCMDYILYVFDCGNGVMARLVEADGEGGNFRIDFRGLSRQKSFFLDNAILFEGFEDDLGEFHEPEAFTVLSGAFGEAMYEFKKFAADRIFAHEPIFGDDEGFYDDEEPWDINCNPSG